MILLLYLLLAFIPFVLTGADYYKVLGLARSASKDEIRRAYKRLSVKFHPDKNPGDEKAHQRFLEISNAYEVLSDERKRDLYDKYGEEGLQADQQSGGHGFHDPFDIFSQFMGGGYRRRSEPEDRKGPEVKMILQVDLKDLFLGKVIEVEVDRQVLCPKCDGSGAKSLNDVETCSSCGGRGIKVFKQMLAPGIYQQVQSTCDKCGGKGKVVKSTCPHCKGRKVVRGTEILDVSIERGMPDGSNIVFEGVSDQSTDHSPGDIRFVLKTNVHSVFTRKGNNLYMKEVITLVEALNGFERKIKHLDDSEVILKRSAITPPGFVQEIKGEGMPIYRDPTKRGKLFVEYAVVFPVGKKLSDSEKKSIEKMFSVSVHSASVEAKEEEIVNTRASDDL